MTRVLHLVNGVDLQLPVVEYLRFTRTHIEVLRSLYLRMKKRQKLSPSGAMYCIPSQTTIGKAVFRSRVRVNRIIKDLVEWGYIVKTQRRKANGIWDTCLYKLGRRFFETMLNWRKALFCFIKTLKAPDVPQKQKITPLPTVKEPQIFPPPRGGPVKLDNAL